MSNFILHNHRNGACPLCGDTKSKCRTTSDPRGDLILCMTLGGTAKGTIIDGYKCLGDTSDGNWAKFITDNTAQWTQQQKEEWQKQRELIRRGREAQEEKRQSQTLSASERDKQYRQLLDELILCEEDRQDLIKRGFTHEQIKLCEFKSVNQWQKLQEKYSHLLPGVNIYGDGILTQGGYLCPVRNADGLIVAIQVRLRKVTEDKGRYRWLTSKTKKRPHGQTPHLYPQGKKELPLHVVYLEQGTGNREQGIGNGEWGERSWELGERSWENGIENGGKNERKQHQQNTVAKSLVNQIGICEGTGAKPFLLSQRLGIPVIGAAGGQFASSPLTFKESLEKLAQRTELGSRGAGEQRRRELGDWGTQSRGNTEQLNGYTHKSMELVIYPDAGDIQNPQVMRRWQKTIELIDSLGYRAKVAWWGQQSKENDPDIDEIEPSQTQSIRLLTEVREQGTGNSAETPRRRKTQGNARQEREQVQESRKKASEKHFGKRSIEYLSCSQFLAKSHGYGFGEQRTKIIRALPPYRKEWVNWNRHREFTPHHTINQRYFHWISPQEREILAVRSGTGTGKTYWLLNTLLKENAQNADRGVVSLGYRNSVLLQFCEQARAKGFNFYHLQSELEGPTRILTSDPKSKIALCSDSLIHLSPDDFEGKILIIDEIESIIKHTLRSKTAVARNREKIKEIFKQALNKAHSIVLLDGHLKDSTIQYLENLLDEPRKIIKVKNEYKGNKGKFEFYLGGTKSNQGSVKSNKKDYSQLFQQIKHHDGNFVVASDNQVELESLDHILTSQGKKVLRYDSTTSNQDWVKFFLRNPEQFIRENQIEVLLYSPSAEAGISIDIQGYFQDLYFIFCGIITTDAQLQMLARVRDSEARGHVFCVEKGLANPHHRDTLSDDLQRNLVESIVYDVLLATEGISPEELTGNLVSLTRKLIDFSQNPHSRREIELATVENYESQNLRTCLWAAMEEEGYQVYQSMGKNYGKGELKEKKEEILLERGKKIHEAPDISLAQAESLARNFGATQEQKDQCARRFLLERLPGIEEKHETVEVEIPKTEIKAPISTMEESNQPPASSDEAGSHSFPLPPAPYLAPRSPFPVPCSLTKPIERRAQSPEYEPGSVEEFFCGDSEDSHEQPKFELRKEEKPLFTPEFIKRVKFDERTLISRLEMLWWVSHPEEARKLHRALWHKKLNIFSDPEEPDTHKRISLSGFNFRHQKARKLIQMGISWFLVPGQQWTENTPEVIEFYRQGKKKSTQKALGQKVGRDTPVAYVGRCLRTIGYSTQSRGNGRTGRTYSLKELDAQQAAIYECVDTRIRAELVSDRVRLVNFEKLVQRVMGTSSCADKVKPAPVKLLWDAVQAGDIVEIVNLVKNWDRQARETVINYLQKIKAGNVIEKLLELEQKICEFSY